MASRYPQHHSLNHHPRIMNIKRGGFRGSWQ
uniref:Uncharacterized protein n=1 Tax=Rhizophora mucronata TaxID=61149 RepID=A0A2P2PDX1_RHIMU